MATKLVSVIIPTFNIRSEWLCQAINSVLNQSYKNTQIIVIDDYSHHPFSDVQKLYTDQRIIWLTNAKNLGVSATRNRGANIAEGEYLAFLDADDWWAPEKLKKQMQQLEKDNVKWVYCSACLVSQNGDPVDLHPAQHKGNVFKYLLASQIITGSCSGVVVEKNLFKDLKGFDESGKIVEDWDMWLRLGRFEPVTYVKEPLVFLRTFIKSSRSAQFSHRIERIKNIQNRYRDELKRAGLEKHAKAHYCYVSARQNFIAGHVCLALLYIIKGFFVSPKYYTYDRLHFWLKKVKYYF